MQQKNLLRDHSIKVVTGDVVHDLGKLTWSHFHKVTLLGCLHEAQECDLVTFLVVRPPRGRTITVQQVALPMDTLKMRLCDSHAFQKNESSWNVSFMLIGDAFSRLTRGVNM